jgi:hypothetical protein
MKTVKKAKKVLLFIFHPPWMKIRVLYPPVKRKSCPPNSRYLKRRRGGAFSQSCGTTAPAE